MGRRMRDVYLETDGLDLQGLESYGRDLIPLQRGINWYVGDVARAAERISPDNWPQVFPECSPDHIARCMAVAKAYPREEDRNPDASWTLHMRNANRPDRIQRVREHVEAGRNSDEAAKADREDNGKPRWLLAFDIHYFFHRTYYSGAGVETAMTVSEWVKRTVERLKEKGATDVLLAFEGHGSFRKELTEEWEDHRYKENRSPKQEDMKHQLQLLRELLEKFGFACVSVDGYEADDVLASAANQFPGKTTIISADKDLRQCLSDKTNILLDVEWIEDETSGELMPDYKWLTAKMHTEEKGIRPDQWPDYQAIAGDSVDCIQGVAGIGEKGAADLIKEFGTVYAVIEAAKNGDERIRQKKRDALIEFESRLEITRRLVTLVDSLPIPNSTRV